MSDQMYRRIDPNTTDASPLIVHRDLNGDTVYEIKVEPCEHGNYARHPIEATVKVISKTMNEATIESVVTYVMCDGKPEGEQRE